MLQFLQKKSMYVLTLCRDYISVTSNGPCTFPGGRGMYPIKVYFGAILKTPPSSLWEKKPFSPYQLTFCLCIYVVKPFNLAILKWTGTFVKGAQSLHAHSHWVSYNYTVRQIEFWKSQQKFLKVTAFSRFLHLLSTQGETTDNNKSVFRPFNVV